ncbi:cellulase family glycosylhydrolase [Agarivorans sp. B2Z047]|uniref:cellulase family glycosylhydrolase n=1 Tax=Agarivorans sp. B2Z047 TaxID=2652721 RepID=UPI00128CFC0B|nr:cellulase family glycosylhydrolase [Agarivorans sp. B2Z047]MPW31447.1 cellulase family glycosylhydrolase [Agarivorans sp. B2Z047]UQN42490.1 cellulase family glycosylhydrolase [Agarivorans sp. B2Z047]
MFRINKIASALTLALVATQFTGCDASYANDPSNGGGGEEPGYESPGGNGTSANTISYQGNDIYLNGVNVAWLSFAEDFGQGLDETQLNHMLDQVKEAGGNTIRWWIHVNGTQSPVWNADRSAIAPAADQQQVIDDIERALDLAQAKGIYVMPCLWSFDMLAATQANMTNQVLSANHSLLTDSTVLQGYIDNFLNPLLDRVAGHPALVAIDLFNEPENMTESWFIDRESLDSALVPDYNDIHTTTAILSNAIHNKADELGEQVLVTTGPKSLGLLNADGFGGTNHYSDANMIALGGDNAALDFYAPHYYDDQGKEGTWSPFYHKASYWELDKPVVIGEFFADKDAYKPAEFDYFGDPIGEEQLCVRLSENEYAGGISWQWTNQYQASVLNCVRALSGADAPDPSAGSSYDFEDGEVPFGFSSSSDSSGSGQLEITAAEGRSDSNALSLRATEAEGEKQTNLLLPVDPQTMPEVATVNVWVKIPQAAADAGYSGGKIFVKTGDAWTWAEGDWFNANVGEWTLFSWTPATVLTDIRELGVQIYAGENSAAADGVAIYFDDVSLLAQAELPEPPVEPSFTYDFEANDSVPTELSGTSDSSGTVALSLTTDGGVDSSKAVLMTVNEAGAEKKPNFVQAVGGSGTLGAASFMVKLSSEAVASGITGGKVFAKTGEGFTWNEGPWTVLTADTWTEVSWTLPIDGALSNVQELGLAFYAGSGDAAVNVEITIDNIQIDN